MTRISRRPRLALLAVLGLVAVPVHLRADEGAALPTVDMFIEREAHVLHVVARVPAQLLADANLPTLETGYLDLKAVDEPLRLVAADLAAALDVWADGVPRPVTTTRVLVSRPTDASFASYDAAAAHVQGPLLPVDEELDASDGVVDIELTYSIPADHAELSARLNGLRAGSERAQTTAHYLTPGGASRTFDITGDPERVWFDPTWQQVAQRFLALGLQDLLGGGDHLLFLFCLLIPWRRAAVVLTVMTALELGQVTTLTIAALSPSPLSTAWLMLAATVAAACLIVGAIQNVVSPESPWVWRLAWAFGLVDGLRFGTAFSGGRAFAGVHPAVALLTFVVPIVFGEIWLVLVLRPVIRLVRGWLSSGQVGIIVLSAFIIHSGLHRVMERGPLLTAAPWPTLNEPFFRGAGLFALLLLAVGLLMAALAARLDPTTRRPLAGSTSSP